MKTQLKVIILLIALFLQIIFTNPAHAYIDPGTGSMIVQAVIAAVAAVSVSIGIFWRRIRPFFDRLFGRNHDK